MESENAEPTRIITTEIDGVAMGQNQTMEHNCTITEARKLHHAVLSRKEEGRWQDRRKRRRKKGDDQKDKFGKSERKILYREKVVRGKFAVEI